MSPWSSGTRDAVRSFEVLVVSSLSEKHIITGSGRQLPAYYEVLIRRAVSNENAVFFIFSPHHFFMDMIYQDHSGLVGNIRIISISI